MAEQKQLNIDVPEDCLKIVQSYLDKSNKAGCLSLEDAFVVHLSLKNLGKSIVDQQKLVDNYRVDFDKMQKEIDELKTKLHVSSEV